MDLSAHLCGQRPTVCTQDIFQVTEWVIYINAERSTAPMVMASVGPVERQQEAVAAGISLRAIKHEDTCNVA